LLLLFHQDWPVPVLLTFAGFASGSDFAPNSLPLFCRRPLTRSKIALGSQGICTVKEFDGIENGPTRIFEHFFLPLTIYRRDTDDKAFSFDEKISYSSSALTD